MKKATAKTRQLEKSSVVIPAAQVRNVVLKPGEWKSKIVLEPRARATIFECDVFPSSAKGKRNQFDMDVTIGKEAELHYVVLVNGGKGIRTIKRKSMVKAGGAMHWHIVTLGGHGDRHELVSTLAGKNAASSIDWIFFVRGDEKQHVSACTNFAAPGGRGEIAMKGVAQDHGYIQCDGKIEITKRGKGTDTSLAEKILLLDKAANADAVPELVIRTNDVKASHSAAVSRVSPEDLFYLQSRGLRSGEARRIYVEGFLSDLVQRVSEENVRVQLLSSIHRLLG